MPGPKVQRPSISIICNNQIITFGSIVEEGEEYGVIVLDARLVGLGGMNIVVKTEDDFARLWDTLEREFSDLIAVPRHWGEDGL